MRSVKNIGALAAITLTCALTATAPGLVAQAPEDSAPFGRFDVDAELQVFPTDISPRYAETLTAGTVVRVGEASRGFRKVYLPIGTRGYVHTEFTTPIGDDGTVQAKTKLSYRYQPQSGQAPVAIVDADTVFHVVGTDGEWWMVRFPGNAAWVPEASIVVFDGGLDNPTLTSAWSALEERHRTESLDHIAGVRAAAAESALIQEREAKLTALREAFRATAGKPVTERDYSGVKAETEAFLASLAAAATTAAEAGSDEPVATDPFVARVERFRDRIDTEITIVDATRFVEEPPKPIAVEAIGGASITRRVDDPAARFDAIGWLQWEQSLGGQSTIRLMKGRQVLHDLICSSGRYDLRMFDGLEVGLVGPKARPSVESIRLLDVEKIEVLHAPLRR